MIILRRIYLLTIAQIFISNSVFAQFFIPPVDKETGLITYTEVVNHDSLTQIQLYTRFKKWAANNFRSANVAIVADDENKSFVVIQSIFAKPVSMPDIITNFNSDCDFRLKVEFKDAKYKYTLSPQELDFAKHNPGHMTLGRAKKKLPFTESSMTFTKKKIDALHKQVDAQCLSLISSLKSGMSEASSKSDW
jgi:hypothetical protein